MLTGNFGEIFDGNEYLWSTGYFGESFDRNEYLWSHLFTRLLYQFTYHIPETWITGPCLKSLELKMRKGLNIYIYIYIYIYIKILVISNSLII